MTKRILITGGAGFIGSNLAHFIQKNLNFETENFRIVVLDALTYSGNLKNLAGLDIDFVNGDVRDFERVKEIVSKVDWVFHLAAETHVDRSIVNPEIFVETNIKGTFNVLEAATRYSKRVVLVSTDEVYGSILIGSADEDYPLHPSSPYSASKASADLLALAYYKTFGTDVVITRCSNNYGPRQFPEKLIPLAIARIMQNERVPIYGTGLNIRDWIHVEDHCSGLYLAMKNGVSGNIYNLGNSELSSNIDLVKKILDILEKDESFLDFVDDRSGHDFRYSINSDRARKDLGWVPQYSLNSSLRHVINYYSRINL